MQQNKKLRDKASAQEKKISSQEREISRLSDIEKANLITIVDLRNKVAKKQRSISNLVETIAEQHKTIAERDKTISDNLRPIIITEAEPFPSVGLQRDAALSRMHYDKYLNTPEWKERSSIIRKRFGNRCQTCNSSNKKLEVHHRTYERRGNELPTDLTLLCEECHKLIQPVQDKEGR